MMGVQINSSIVTGPVPIYLYAAEPVTDPETGSDYFPITGQDLRVHFNVYAPEVSSSQIATLMAAGVEILSPATPQCVWSLADADTLCLRAPDRAAMEAGLLAAGLAVEVEI